MNDKINPSHYHGTFPYAQPECIDFTRHMAFSPGNAVKYIYRLGNKSGENWQDDLAKAKWYLNDCIANEPDASYAAAAVFGLIDYTDVTRMQEVQLDAMKLVIEGRYELAMLKLKELEDLMLEYDRIDNLKP